MRLGPTVEDPGDSGVRIAMIVGVGAEVCNPITAVVGVELGIDVIAASGSGSDVGFGDTLHPAS